VFKRAFFIIYKNNTVSLCVATAAVGRVPDGGIKIAIKKDYCAIHDDTISVIARSRIYVVERTAFLASLCAPRHTVHSEAESIMSRSAVVSNFVEMLRAKHEV